MKITAAFKKIHHYLIYDDEYVLKQRCFGCQSFKKTWYGYKCLIHYRLFNPIICPFKTVEKNQK